MFRTVRLLKTLIGLVLVALSALGVQGEESGLPLRISVSVKSQRLDVLGNDATIVRSYTISTSRYGVGSSQGSNKTPSGKFRIAEKIGDGAAIGEIFVSRVATGLPARMAIRLIMWRLE